MLAVNGSDQRIRARTRVLPKGRTCETCNNTTYIHNNQHNAQAKAITYTQQINNKQSIDKQ